LVGIRQKMGKEMNQPVPVAFRIPRSHIFASQILGAGICSVARSRMLRLLLDVEG
jgi:hypothetical protein